MDAASLVKLLREIGTFDTRAWTVSPLRRAEWDSLSHVLDPQHVRGPAGWIISVDDRPVLVVVEGRIHWAGMSVPIAEDPFLAVGQTIAAISAARATDRSSLPDFVRPRGRRATRFRDNDC